MEGGETDDALKLLEKSLKMNKTILGEDDYSNSIIHTLMARAYVKKGKYQEAIQQYSIVWEYAEAKYGLKSKEVAEVFLELADTYDKNKEYKDAVEFQRRAFDTFKEVGGIDKKKVATMAITLGEMYGHNEILDEAVAAMREARA
eukprot:TRINITY_DN13438_c0_g2_i3.p1 TRINITY_DN13438_c0_g2~~TRINITY_DN13438_c0_g2_i3.p1  ORF type:complete len:145 (+),score=51.09 TRINITY_DN13438_c0_g2_i3:562-996(+)